MSFRSSSVSPSANLVWFAAALMLGVCLIVFPTTVHGQTARKNKPASVSGTVTDSVGNVVAGATVSLDGPTKGEVQSETNGAYTFTNLAPGRYSLTAVAPNFPKLTLSDINVTAGRELSLDVTLEGTLPSAVQPAPSQAPTPAATPAEQQPSSPAVPMIAPTTTQMPVLAQQGPGKGKASISGAVNDQTGAAVPNAKIVLGGPGGTREGQSGATGTYAFTDLDPGTYNVIASSPNFAEKHYDNISVTAGQQIPLDIGLEPAAAVEKVNVEATEAGKVETETSTSSETIETKQVVGLQLNGRNFSQLIALAPGVSNQTGQDEGKVGVVGSVKYSVNGGRVEYNTFEIDGSDVLNTGLNRSASTLVVYPSLDAIQEVKVLTANYSAQYGRTASGTVQVTTKSGTSGLHGNLYDFTRNEAFNARNYFDLTSKAPLYRRQDFGGTIGGPVTIPHVYNTRRDKTFFFFSEEVRLEKSPIEYNQAVPGLKERGLIMTAKGIQPNISPVPDATTGLFGRIFDFTDVCAGSGSSFNRSQFPDCPALPGSGTTNLAPITSLETSPTPSCPNGQCITNAPGGVDKNALAILNANLIPLPNSPIGCNYSLPLAAILGPDDPNRCYVATVSPSTYWREELFRLDHNVTSKLRLSFRYVHDAWDTTVLTPQWNYLSITNPSAGSFPTIQNRFVGPGLSLVAEASYAINPTLLNTTVVSYTNSTITLADRNGPGGAQFQRNPTLDLPLIGGAGGCNPALSVDPVTGFSECGMGYLFNNGFGGKMPGVAVLGTNAAYGGRGFAFDPSYMPWEHSNPTYSIRDDVGKAFGRHTLQFGAEYVLYQRNQDNNVIGGASGDTHGLLQYANSSWSTGNAFADFLGQFGQLGFSSVAPVEFIQSFTQDSAQHRYYQRYQLAEPYVQDDWKVTPRLTLNLGLRLSLFGLYTEKNRAAWNWEASQFDRTRFTVDPTFGDLLDHGIPVGYNPTTFALDPSVVKGLGLVQCGLGGVPAGCMSGHLFNWAPRVGFAWDPKGDGKTSIRGGYGMFYEHGTGNESNTGSLEASAPVVLSVTQPVPTSFMCIGNVGFGTFNQSVTQSIGSYCGVSNNPAPPPNSLYPIDVTSIPTKAVWPYVQQWSLGIQREVSRDFVVNVGYAGSKGTRLTVERQLNQLPPLPASENPFGPNEPFTTADCTVGPAGNSGSAGPGVNNAPFVLQSGTLVSSSSPAYVHLLAACSNVFTPNVNSLSLRPYPGLGRVLSLQNGADSSYHAFQFSARRTRGALTTGVSYSYSHSIDDSSDRSDPVLANSYDLRENRASSNFDERHLLTVNYIYQFSLRGLVHGLFDWANDNEHSKKSSDVTPSSCCSGFKGQLLDGWEFSGITLVHSGTPFSVINTAGNTGISVTDNAGVASGLGIAASYPDVVRGLGKPGNNLQSFGPLLGNPSQFVAPRGLTFGNAGRNFLNNPRQINFDMAFAKRFRISEAGQLEFRAEAFNIFNHTEFRIYDPDNPGSTGNNIISCYAGPAYSAGYKGSAADCVTGASFLHPVDAHRPRTIQVALKFAF